MPVNKDDRQSTPTNNNNNNSQQSQEMNSMTGKNIELNKSTERQSSQSASNCYTVSQTHDQTRYFTLNLSFFKRTI